MTYRIPRRIPLGKGYCVSVVLVSPSAIKEIMENDEPGDHYDGCWAPEYAHPNFGTIYINNRLNVPQRWKTYFHELIHAVNDLAAWTDQHPLAT